MQDIIAQPLLVMYYLVLMVFVLVVVVLILYYTLRMGYEVSILSSGEKIEKGSDWFVCFVLFCFDLLFVYLFVS
jgi:hypothetical protein